MAGTSEFCGVTWAQLELRPSGPMTVKAYREPFVIFTDVVVFVRPPTKYALKKALPALVAGALQSETALHLINEKMGGSVEEWVDHVNERLTGVINRCGMDKISSADVISEFGDWADVWQNQNVVSASLRTKGFFPKMLEIKLIPRSGTGLSRRCTLPTNAKEIARTALTKAFGSRFHAAA